MYKTGMTVQYTTPAGQVKTGKYVKDTPSGRAVVMVDGRKTLPPKKILRQVKKKPSGGSENLNTLLALGDLSGKISKEAEKLREQRREFFSRSVEQGNKERL